MNTFKYYNEEGLWCVKQWIILLFLPLAFSQAAVFLFNYKGTSAANTVGLILSAGAIGMILYMLTCLWIEAYSEFGSILAFLQAGVASAITIWAVKTVWTRTPQLDSVIIGAVFFASLLAFAFSVGRIKFIQGELTEGGE